MTWIEKKKLVFSLSMNQLDICATVTLYIGYMYRNYNIASIVKIINKRSIRSKILLLTVLETQFSKAWTFVT